MGYLFSGIWGEGSFIFRDMGRNWGFREQGVEEKHFRELGRKVIFLSGSREQRPLLGRPQNFHCENRGYGLYIKMMIFKETSTVHCVSIDSKLSFVLTIRD